MEEDLSECPICLEERSLCAVVPCNHRFCQRCINKLLRRSCLCPTCRGVFTDAHPPLVTSDASVHVRRGDSSYGIVLRQEGNRIVVSKVDKMSSADRMGVVSGAEVVAINGLPCYNTHCALEQLRSTTNVHITLLQAGIDPSRRCSWGKDCIRIFLPPPRQGRF